MGYEAWSEVCSVLIAFFATCSGLLKTLSSPFAQADAICRLDTSLPPGLDLWHQICRLRGRGKAMQIAEAELVFSTLVKNLNNDGQVIEVSLPGVVPFHTENPILILNLPSHVASVCLSPTLRRPSTCCTRPLPPFPLCAPRRTRDPHEDNRASFCRLAGSPVPPPLSSTRLRTGPKRETGVDESLGARE